MATTTNTATVAEHRERLEAAVKQAASEEGWVAWLRLRAAAHSYSWANTMLLLIQRPDATVVGGASNFWKQFGRYPAKGSKALRVYAPIFATVDKGTPDERRVCVRFKLVPVFDVSQTDGDELPAAPVLVPVLGDAPTGMLESLVAAAQADGVTISYDHDDLGDGVKGDYNRVTRHIRIAAGLSGCEVATTMAHELSHHFDLADEQAKGTTYADAEVVAESSSYIVATHWGIDTAGFSTGYVTGWAKGDSKRIQQVAKRIDETAKRILEARAAQEVAA